METISGANNWELTVRRETEGVTLLRCMTCDERAVLPEMLWNLPVTALADHAFTPHAPETEGEIIRMVCGPGTAAPWDNAALRELTLPPTLRRVGEYAFFNCRALQQLSLSDSVTVWGSGVWMNCRELDTIELFQPDGDHGGLAYFAGELNRELDVTVYHAGGVAFRLIFPAYWELYEENSPAHHFDYGIEGVGYPYHHCFRQRRLNLIEYDSLWPKQSPNMEERTALRLAWWRLRYPKELTGQAAAWYLAYLRQHTGTALAWLLEERDVPGLLFLLQKTQPDRNTLSHALSLAREQRFTEAVAVLLEEQHRRFPNRDDGCFAL